MNHHGTRRSVSLWQNKCLNIKVHIVSHLPNVQLYKEIL